MLLERILKPVDPGIARKCERHVGTRCSRVHGKACHQEGTSESAKLNEQPC